MERGSLAVFLCVFLSSLAFGQNWSASRGSNQLQELKFFSPDGWELHQDVKSDNTLILGYSNGEAYFRIYVKDRDGFDFRTVFPKASPSTNVEKIGPMDWTTSEMQHSPPSSREPVNVKAFMSERNGYVYYGFARSNSASKSREMVNEFLRGLLVKPIGMGRSLTGVGYTGKKYFLAFGDTLSGFMGNEVKYDMKHTSDIFTKQWGGNYVGQTLHSHSLGGTQIRQKWREIGGQLSQQDMYVQYSAGHGSHSGLEIGVSYDEIRDNALSYAAKEVIVFTMACYSGNLVSSFNRKMNEWKQWANQGRTLFVMASSQPHETSATGPITDSDEPGGPSGSAGSAFGHALWKALIGYADGFNDGVKDGFISLGEIKDYAIWKTRQIGHHTPVVTGVFNPAMLMNRVPPKSVIAALEGSSEGLSESEIIRLIEELDEEFRIK